ncbi:MAG: hypothetical protein ACPIA7_03435 [Akkermansiaceae bacterium]
MPEIDGRVILLIVFVAISAIKWLMEKIQGSSQPDAGEESNDTVETLYEQYRDEIRQRQTKLQKKPAPVETPPPLPPSPKQPPQRPQPTQGSSYRQSQTQQQRQAPVQKRPAYAEQPVAPAKPTPDHTPKRTVVSAEQRAAASRFEKRSGSQHKPSAQRYVRTLLSNPESTRQAIILSEILGKPKSLQGG